MVWRIEFSELARKQLAKLDRPVAQRISSFLRERVTQNTDPRISGKSLKGELKQYWRYRVGDWRILCEIKDESVTVLVLHVGHRREIYR